MKKNFIDFKKLTTFELKNLSEKWERAALDLEFRMQQTMKFDPDNTEKIMKMWNIGNNLWRRLATLEKWRRRNRPRVVK